MAFKCATFGTDGIAGRYLVTMSGIQRIYRPKNIVAYYRAEALRCREEAKRETFFQRRYELEARAEHLEEIIQEIK